MTGPQLLAAGAWNDARRVFESALAERESAESLEGLGLAAWWLDDADAVFASRERAYKLYLDADDARSAARVAVWLAWDCWAFRGETAVASGWLQRARRLLEPLPESPELAWLEARESQLALAEDGDPDRAHLIPHALARGDQGDRRAAVPERAHGASPRGQYPEQAQRFVQGRRRRASRPPRPSRLTTDYRLPTTDYRLPTTDYCVARSGHSRS